MHPINCRNEEEVKIQIVLPWLESLGYKKELMEFEKTIEVNEGRKSKKIFADIVIYTSKKKDTPIIVVDTKAPNEIHNLYSISSTELQLASANRQYL